MSFRDERLVKATRKRHLCQACDKWIEIGEQAINWVGMTDGEFDSLYYHTDCREAEVALNRLHDWGWYDDWMRLCEIESEDRPWLKTEYPEPYLRMCMSRERYAALKARTLPHDR